jgi:hypothetical protein
MSHEDVHFGIILKSLPSKGAEYFLLKSESAIIVKHFLDVPGKPILSMLSETVATVQRGQSLPRK